MAPGKRSTRKKKADDPVSKEREKVVENLILSLDAHIEQYKKTMLSNFELAKDQMRGYYRSLEQRLPDNVKNMKMEQFLAQNIDLNIDLEATNERITAAHKRKMNTNSVVSKFVKKHNSKPKLTPSESTTSKKVISTKRRSIAGKTARSSASKRRSRIVSRQSSTKRQKNYSTDDSYVDVSDDEVFFTPKPSRIPLTGVTPKFDTRKPLLRSELRHARPGELAMSLSGSPLLVEGRKNSQSEIKVNVGSKTFLLSDPSTTKGKPKPKERKEILQLRNIIDQMLKK